MSQSMFRKYQLSIFTVIALFILTGAVNSQSDSLKIDSILTLHKASLGDLESISSMKTLIINTNVTVQGNKGETIICYKFPDCYYFHSDFGFYSFTAGYNGETAWARKDNGEIRVNDSNDIVTARNDLYFEGFKYLFSNSVGEEIIIRNDTIIESAKYHQLTLFPPEGDSISILINSHSGRLEYSYSFKEDGVQLSAYSEFNNVNGIPMPFHLDIISPQSDLVVDAESRTVNQDIPDSLFSIPDTTDAKFISFGFSNNCDSSDIKFKLKNNSVVFEGIVNGKKKFKFLLDTGAGSTLISKKMAKKLRLKAIGESSGVGVSGKAGIEFGKIDSIQFNDIFWYPNNVSILADKNMSSDVFRGFDAIIGYDFLINFPVQVDFDKKLITVFNPKNEKTQPSGKPIGIDLDTKTAMKQAKLDGRPIRLIIDLGSANDITLFSNYRWFYKYSEKLRHEKAMHESRGIGDVIRSVKLTTADILEIDSLEIVKPMIGLLPRPDNFTEDSRHEALIGVKILQQFNLYIDYPNNLIYFAERK